MPFYLKTHHFDGGHDAERSDRLKYAPVNARNAVGVLCAWLVFYAIAALGGYFGKSVEVTVAAMN